MNKLKQAIRNWLEIKDPFEPATYWTKQASQLARTARKLEGLYLGSDYELHVVTPTTIKVVGKKKPNERK